MRRTCFHCVVGGGGAKDVLLLQRSDPGTDQSKRRPLLPSFHSLWNSSLSLPPSLSLSSPEGNKLLALPDEVLMSPDADGDVLADFGSVPPVIPNHVCRPQLAPFSLFFFFSSNADFGALSLDLSWREKRSGSVGLRKGGEERERDVTGVQGQEKNLPILETDRVFNFLAWLRGKNQSALSHKNVCCGVRYLPEKGWKRRSRDYALTSGFLRGSREVGENLCVWRRVS